MLMPAIAISLDGYHEGEVTVPLMKLAIVSLLNDSVMHKAWPLHVRISIELFAWLIMYSSRKDPVSFLKPTIQRELCNAHILL